VTQRAERARASGAVAIASALLQSVASFPLAFSVAWFGMLLSDHAHALISAPDGTHLDLVLTHDPARGEHDHGGGTHLHASHAEDHVVHLTSDEVRNARQTPPSTLPVALASASQMITVSRVVVLLPPTSPPPVLPLSRRSVVLRT
jgi:hypothetical protein